MEVAINWTAVAAGTVTAIVLGMIWYNPKVFGEKWMKAIGLTEKQMKKGEMAGMITAMVRSFVLSFSLFHIIYVTDAFYGDKSLMQNAIGVGLWIGIAVVGLTMLMHDTFEQRPRYATKVHVGFEIVTILAVSIVIAAVAS